jgi:V8-like Glu-specific endopeptidase
MGVSCAQTAAPGPTPPPQPTDPMQHWRNATVALGQVITLGQEKRFVVTGSAVIVALDAKRGCLLTARHMLVDPDNGQIARALWMRIPSSVGESEPPVELTLFDRRGNNLWMSSTDGSDLAVIPVPSPKLGFMPSNLEGVFVSDFGQTQNDIYQGARVLVLGYPQFLRKPDQTNPYSTTPVARTGIVAWVDPSSPVSKPFLVDANLYGGNSGGPVFAVKNGFDRYGNFDVGGAALTLIGIVSQGPFTNAQVVAGNSQVTRPNPQTGIPEDEFARVPYVGGIGVVEPVSRAKKLLDDYFAKH